MSAEDQLHQFTRGLHPKLAALVNLQDAKTIAEAERIAVRAGAAHMSSSSSSAAAAAPSSEAMDVSMNNIEGLERDTDADDDAPVTQKQLMQLLAAMQHGPRRAAAGAEHKRPHAYTPRGLPVIKGMTEKQVKEFMDGNKCFRCGSTEHRSRGCSAKLPTPAPGN